MKTGANAPYGTLRDCRFDSSRWQHPRQINSVLMEGTGSEMAKHQQRPQCLVEDYRCPTDMAVLIRSPTNNDVYPVADDGCTVASDECPMKDD